MGFNRKWARAGCVVLLVALAAGCNDEASQRKAFIAYLQTRIIDKPGLHVPHPTEAEDEAQFLFAKHGMKLLRHQRAELDWRGAKLNLIGVDYQRVDRRINLRQCGLESMGE